MDSLFCGVKCLEEGGRNFLSALEDGGEAGAEASANDDASSGGPAAAGSFWGRAVGLLLDGERGAFFFGGDAVTVLERLAEEPVPPFTSDKSADTLALRSAQVRGLGRRVCGQ
jgi:hypothetical protein